MKWANEQPCASDKLADWLSHIVTSALAPGSIETVGDLARLVVRGGRRWWHPVPRLGARKAGKVEAWIRHCAPALIAGELIVHSSEAQQRSESLLHPFETFNVPDDLDGRCGKNRYRGRLSPDWADDRAALAAWLDMYRSNEATYRSYRRMVQRIWLWSVLVRGKALSSLSEDDCIAYFRFLLNLPEGWVRSTFSDSGCQAYDDWRPFAAPVSVNSLDTHFSCMRSLFSALQTWNYLEENPMRQLRFCEIVEAATTRPGWHFTDPNRSFSMEQWQFLLGFADNNNARPHDKRAAFILRFCYYVGLRYSELCDRRVAHLIPPGRGHHPRTGWRLKVTGPRQIARAAEVPESAFAILRQYMVDRGYAPRADAWPPEAPLIVRLSPSRCCESDAQASLDKINRSMKRFFRRAAKAVSTTHPEWYGQIERAGGLWLRASLVRHEMAQGASFVDLSQRLGYESVHSFEQFESPPVDHAASLRNWDRHLEETWRLAEERNVSHSYIEDQDTFGTDPDTRRKP
ncbi:phage integrase family protein [Paraburkholderia nemoris]|uniref:phage integrase family protein n=1 Tax=Paraburkholderia nemoris TaxID=2793076 RepID=UPI0038B89076